MKPFFLTLIAGLLLSAPQARAQVPAGGAAQVTINQAALDQLAGIAPPAPTPAPAPELKPTPAVHKLYHRHPAPKPALSTPVIAPAVVTTAKPSTPTPQLPSASISAPVIPKIAPPPAAPAPVQQAVAKPAPLAPKPAAPAPAPAIITFATGAADLPASAAATLKPFCLHPAAGQVVTIDAYAAANPSDPSSAPRLSMNRAFALRDALTACGVASANIIPRADGAIPGKNPDTAVISAAGASQ